MIAAAASTAGIGGIVVRPAPSRAPRSRFEDVPSRLVEVEPGRARADPKAVEASRLEARETVDAVPAIPAGWVPADASEAEEGVPAGLAGPAGASGEPQTSQ